MKNINTDNFVTDNLMRFELKDIIANIRYLLKMDNEEEEEFHSYFEISYNEEIFIELIT